MNDATLAWRGKQYRFEPNLGRHALHGVAIHQVWELSARGHAACLYLDLADSSWPFGGVVEQEISLAKGCLTLSARIRATKQAMPAALGWHPWFVGPAGTDLHLRVPAEGTLQTDSELIPTGAIEPLTPLTDLRQRTAVRDRPLDHTYVGVREAAVFWPDVELGLQFGPTISNAVVHVRGRAICVEPQTSWPNAAELYGKRIRGTGIAVLEPGESITAQQTWTWRSANRRKAE